MGGPRFGRVSERFRGATSLGWSDRDPAIAAALERVPSDLDDLLAALSTVPERRAELDDVERTLIDAARDSGASWTQIAAALGLRSRQAAEQRRLRLGAPGSRRDPAAARERRQRQRVGDAAAGEQIVALRAAVRDLAAGIDRTPGWDDQGPRARLARRTLSIALDADPGALVDLTRHVVDDLATIRTDLLGGTGVEAARRRMADIVGAG